MRGALVSLLSMTSWWAYWTWAHVGEIRPLWSQSWVKRSTSIWLPGFEVWMTSVSRFGFPRGHSVSGDDIEDF